MAGDNETLPLRYRIKSLLAMCTAKESAAIKAAIMRENGLSLITYRRYLNLRMNDSNDIPAKVLSHFARLLGTTIEALFNTTTEPAAAAISND